MILLWTLAAVAFFKMPDTVPAHFNASGQADDYGNKVTIFILPIIATLLFIGLTALNRYPQIYNYPGKITEANVMYEYSKATRMVRFLKVLITIVFTTITLSTFLTAIHVINGLGSLFLPLMIVLLSVLTISSAVMAFKQKIVKNNKVSKN